MPHASPRARWSASSCSARCLMSPLPAATRNAPLRALARPAVGRSARRSALSRLRRPSASVPLTLQQFQISHFDFLGGFAGAAAREDREAGEEGLLFL